MCDKAILENGGTLELVLDQFKTHEMCDKLLIIMFVHKNLFLHAIKLKKYVIKLLILILLQ